MPEVKRFYTQSLPAMKLVGKCYTEKDSIGGSYAAKWGEWFEKDLFAPLELKDGGEEPFEDCDAYIGLCRVKNGEPMQYWIGVFLPLDAIVPEGYDSVALEAGEVAVCWIYGKEPDIFMYNSIDKVVSEGYEWIPDKDGVMWFFERYACPRYTMPDENGNVILDACYYVKRK